jgi:hypothetical protein
MKRLAFLFFLLFPSIAVPQSVRPKTTAAPARPSLDLLVARVDAYWKLLLAGRRLRAAVYVLPSDRNKFGLGTTPQFTNPRLKSLELSKDRTEATVTVTINRFIPSFPSEMDWPVTEHWVFQRGTWYCRHAPQFFPMATASPEQMEMARQQIRDRLHFEKTAFDFGTVKQGKNAVLTLKYTLTGDDSVSVTLKSTSPGSENECYNCSRERGINLMDLKELPPGTHKEFSVEVPTWGYDGPVSEQFFIVAKIKNVDAPFEFSVRGNVYAPVSMIPRLLKFKKGEHEKEVVMRNNSKSDLEVNPAISETRAITIEPLPAVIPPGQQLTLKVKLGDTADSAVPNTVDNVAITFVKSVDDVAGLSFRVYLNSGEENQQKTSNRTADSQIQELIRQNQVRSPKR